MCGRNKNCGCENQHSTELAPITAAMVAAADEQLAVEGYSPPERFVCVLTVEGLRTTDHRRIAEKALTWRQLPWSLFAQFKNDGHRGADIVGNMEKITREPFEGVDGAFLIKGEGSWDLTSEQGRRAATMVDKQTLRFGSIDLEVLESQYVEVGSEEGKEVDLIDLLFGGFDDVDWYDEVTHGRIMGHTLVPMPAFPQAVIVSEGMELDVPKPMDAPHLEDVLLASAATVTIPEQIPSHWFNDPELSEPTPLTITKDGLIFGHIALWDTCHIGMTDACVTPPQSQSDYAYFLTGKIVTFDANGEQEERKVGHITFNTGHANTTASWQDTTAHYDNTGTVAADVAVGEDEHGIWFSGALRDNLSEGDVRAIRSAPLSGDWRVIGGGLELVAALAVNVPGFPIVASAGIKQGEQVSLRAAAVQRPDPIRVLARKVHALEQIIQPMKPSIVASLRERVGPGKAKPTLESLQQRVAANQ